MRISQDRAHEALKDLLDPEERWWWSMHGLLLLTKLARAAAGLEDKMPETPPVDGDEIRYWIVVYLTLRRRTGWRESRRRSWTRGRAS